jgi:hypothetical protein
MHGPRRKWRPRIALLILALGLTTAAHLLAAIVGFLASVVFMFYLAERRRSVVLVLITYAAIGALVIDFAFFSFRPEPFTYVFSGGAARFWFSLDGVRAFATDLTEGPILIAAGLGLLLFFGFRRSRYFGNLTPLVMVAATAFLLTTQVLSAPWLWALPFLFTFIGGVFADVLETRQRRLFLATTVLLLASQAIACLATLPSIARG